MNLVRARFDMNAKGTQLASKDGFPHFMLKEIYDQPDAVRTVIEG